MIWGLRRRWAGHLAVPLLAVCSASAAVPDWLQHCLLSSRQLPDEKSTVSDVVASTQATFLTPNQVQVTYRLVRQLSREAGRTALYLGFPYDAEGDQLVSVKGWAVAPDGQTAQAFGRDAFYDGTSTGDREVWNTHRRLEFDARQRVKLGGAAAIEIQFQQELHFSTFEQLYDGNVDLHRAELTITPAPGTNLEWFTAYSIFPRPSLDPDTGSLHWSITDLKGYPENLPTGFCRNRRRILVRCTPTAGGNPDLKTWGTFARAVALLMRPSIDPTGAVQVAARQVASGRTSRWDRIRALTEFVQSEILLRPSALDRDTAAAYRPRPAQAVLQDRSGNSLEKAALLVALLRAIGDDGRVVLLEQNDPTAVQTNWISPQFNAAIVAIPADAQSPKWWATAEAGPLGQWICFDPSDPAAPLGVLSAADQGGMGLLVDEAAGALVRLPVADPEHSGITRRIDAKWSADNQLEVAILEQREGMAGAEAHKMRTTGTAAAYQAALGARIHLRNPLAGEFHWADAWDGPNARQTLRLSFAVPAYGQDLGAGMVMLPPDVLRENSGLQPWQGSPEGVCWLATMAIQNEVHLSLPAGWQVDEVPDAWSEQSPAISGAVSYEVRGSEIIVRERLQHRGALYDAAAYRALAALVGRFGNAVAQPVIVRRVASP